MLQQMLIFVALSLALLATGCRGQDSPARSPSDSKYILWDVSPSCLVAKAQKPKLKMCVTGYGDLERAKAMTERAVLAWLEPLRQDGVEVATAVDFTCDGADGSVNLQGGDGTATAGPGHVNIFDRSAFGTYLHEFGHAFACIGDTYVNGTAGWCVSGQPHSIMCDGLLREDLSADDIAAVRRQFAFATGIQPGDGPGGTPDAEGDSDGDGVKNNRDRCPDTPTGAKVWHDEQNGKWRGCAEGQTPVW